MDRTQHHAIVILLLFITHARLCGQSNYLDYHKGIIKAEQLIANGEVESALSNFEAVFQSYDFIFVRDYKIATQLAFYLGQEEKGWGLMRLGLSHGWTIKGIKKNKFLTPYLKSKEGKQLKAQYDSFRIVYNKSINMALRDTVRDMVLKDQKMALKALFKFGNKSRQKYYENKFVPHSEKQIAKLNQIIKEFGFPGEHLIGNNTWAGVILSHHNSISPEYNNADKLYPELRPKLIEAITDGELFPYEFALMENWKMSVGSNWKIKSYGYLASELTGEEIVKADNLRAEIGLRSIEIRNQLIDKQQETGMDFYLPRRPQPNKKIKIVSNP